MQTQLHHVAESQLTEVVEQVPNLLRRIGAIEQPLQDVSAASAEGAVLHQSTLQPHRLPKAQVCAGMYHR